MQNQPFLFLALLATLLFTNACGSTRSASYLATAEQSSLYRAESGGDPITSSLFTSQTATISEENIRNILDGTVVLPEQMRFSVLNLDSYRSGNYFYNSEYFRDEQAAFLEVFQDRLGNTGRAASIKILPKLLVSPQRDIFTLRESAVRMQADVLLIFSVGSDVYSEFKLFKKDEIKAYATVEALLLDIRTGIVVFAETVSKEVKTAKQESDTGDRDLQRRAQSEASLLAIEEAADRLRDFLIQDQ